MVYLSSHSTTTCCWPGLVSRVNALASVDDAEEVYNAAAIAGQHGGCPVAGLQVVDLVGGEPVQKVKSVLSGGLEAAIPGVAVEDKNALGMGVQSRHGGRRFLQCH